MVQITKEAALAALEKLADDVLKVNHFTDHNEVAKAALTILTGYLVGEMDKNGVSYFEEGTLKKYFNQTN